jgi:hypothetical protein
MPSRAVLQHLLLGTFEIGAKEHPGHYRGTRDNQPCHFFARHCDLLPLEVIDVWCRPLGHHVLDAVAAGPPVLQLTLAGCPDSKAKGNQSQQTSSAQGF